MKNTQVKKRRKYKTWKLGDHVLICADSTNKDAIREGAKLIGKTRMILTDPPYGVAYVENKDWIGLRGGKTGEHKKIENDQLQTDEEYALFTQA